MPVAGCSRPAGQSRQATPPDAPRKRPASQSVQSAAPAPVVSLEKRPGAQSWHARACDWEDVPGGQALHRSAVPAADHLPAAQGKHVLAAEAFSVRKPPGQSRHASSWALGAYLPVGQFRHCVFAALLCCPTEQSEQKVRSSLLSLPAGHATHSLAPSSLPYFPSSHGVQLNGSDDNNADEEALPLLPLLAFGR